ncbi:MAG TPA: host attachment protein [Devosiaceae bacterium]
MRNPTTWVLIADGASARVYRNTGPGTGLKPVEDLEFDAPHGRARDIMADKPGRAFSSAGARRSAMEPSSDPVDVMEAEFVRGLATMLADRLRQGAYDDLIVALAPRALGQLREHLSKDVAARIRHEMASDLVNTKLQDLPRHFEGLLKL